MVIYKNLPSRAFRRPSEPNYYTSIYKTTKPEQKLFHHNLAKQVEEKLIMWIMDTMKIVKMSQPHIGKKYKTGGSQVPTKSTIRT